MSHDIENDCFYSLGEAAWHRLGTVVDEALSVEEVFTIAGLDGGYSLEPLYAQVLTMDGVTQVEVPDKRGICRTLNDRVSVLGVASPSYKIHTPSQVWQGMSHLMDAGCEVQTAGSLDGGRKVFITVKMPKGILAGGQDRSDLYLFGRTSFDGTQATGYDLTAVRVVCWNTWQMALRASQGSVKIRHRQSMDSFGVAQAREALSISYDLADAMTVEAERLASIPLRDDDVTELLSRLFPLTKTVEGKAEYLLSAGEKRGRTKQLTKRAEVAALWAGSKTLTTVPKNGWRFFNAVTEWADWMSPVKANGRDPKERRAERVMLGDTQQIKEKALALVR